MKKYHLHKQKYHGAANGHYGDCEHRKVPFIEVATKGTIANITWDHVWLPISCRDSQTGKDTQLGVLAYALIERYKGNLWECGAGEHMGYAHRVPIAVAEKLACELYDLFMRFLNTEAKQT